MILGVLPAIFNKEMIVPDQDKMRDLSRENIAANVKDFFKGIKLTLQNKPFLNQKP